MIELKVTFAVFIFASNSPCEVCCCAVASSVIRLKISEVFVIPKLEYIDFFTSAMSAGIVSSLFVYFMSRIIGETVLINSETEFSSLKSKFSTSNLIGFFTTPLTIPFSKQPLSCKTSAT